MTCKRFNEITLNDQFFDSLSIFVLDKKHKINNPKGILRRLEGSFKTRKELFLYITKNPILMATSRLRREYLKFMRDPPEGISIADVSPNYQKWKILIMGPENTPYKNGIFIYTFVIPKKYPFLPPKVKCETKVFHPQYTQSGALNLGIIRSTWGPYATIQRVCEEIRKMFISYNYHDVSDHISANLRAKDEKAYNRKVKEYVKKYAN